MICAWASSGWDSTRARRSELTADPAGTRAGPRSARADTRAEPGAAASATDALQEALRTLASQSALVPRIALLVDPALSELVPEPGAEPGAEAVLPLPPAGHLTLRRIEGVPVAAWTDAPSRSVAHRAFPVRVARLLGAEVLMLATRPLALTAASAADLGVVEDHIALLVPNPLVGPNLDTLGTRFPDMTDAYDPGLRDLAREEAARIGRSLPGGVLAGWPDSNLAPAPEYTVLREAGVDWVGWGGVQEVITARHAGMRVLSLIGLEGAERALTTLVRGVIARFA